MEPVTVYIGLGSNLGRRESNLSQAVAQLGESPMIEVLRCSSIYETEPWGYLDQPRFLNCAVEARTTFSPTRLLAFTQGVELSIGRLASFHWGPRLIDLDILLYGDRIISVASPDLQIPHPRISERAFVLSPLAELAPDARHPVSGQTVADLLRNVDGAEGVRLWGPPLRFH